MLLRNLDIEFGECNGSRMRITQLGEHLIECQLVSGSHRGRHRSADGENENAYGGNVQLSAGREIVHREVMSQEADLLTAFGGAEEEFFENLDTSQLIRNAAFEDIVDDRVDDDDMEEHECEYRHRFCFVLCCGCGNLEGNLVQRSSPVATTSVQLETPSTPPRSIFRGIKGLSAADTTPRKQHLKNLVKSKEAHIRKLKKVCRKKTGDIKSLTNIRDSTVVRNVFKGMSSVTTDFLISQLRCAKKSPRGQR
ncbi:hypothetical protein NQ315_011645 [Exocentrus adspersus]|uniref:DNA helicase Pif1-like 2B domain-containing protein n=1 Tax=Exocentrus adspersus TaxID=1586481 RepID=A0AAV8VBG4_9CUCU|nr:hypothetical protein NQ315_011645 [Exocentrus adspersus]